MAIDLDAVRKKPEADRTPEEKTALAAADASKTENQEHMVPKGRLDDEINKRHSAEEKLRVLEEKRQAAEAAALAEQGKWKELAEKRQQELDDLKGKADKVDGYEKTLKENLDAQLAEIPEEMRKLVPSELTTSQQLSWISKNKAVLLKPIAQDIGAGKRGAKKDEPIVELTSDEALMAKAYDMTPEEYSNFKKGVSEEPFKTGSKKKEPELEK